VTSEFQPPAARLPPSARAHHLAARLPPVAIRLRPPPRRRPPPRSEIVNHRVDRADPGAARTTVTNIGRITSHLCVDADTIYFTTRCVSLPSTTPLEHCVLRRIAPNGYAQVVTALSDGRCPDLTELPPPGSAASNNFTLAPNGLYKSVSSPVRLASSIPLPSPFRCENGSRYDAATPPVDWAAITLPAVGGDACPSHLTPGAPGHMCGVWLSPQRDAALVQSGAEWGLLTWGVGASLGAARGTVHGHTCLSNGDAAASSTFTRAFTNGTADAGSRCDDVARRGNELEFDGEAWAPAEELQLEADPALPSCAADASAPAPAGAVVSSARRAAAAGAVGALAAAAVLL
jgi:hypothetical protein